MKDKTILITGGTGGIGKQTASGLAKLGAHVIVTGRDKTRGESAEKTSRSSVYAASITDIAGETGLYISTNSKRTNWPKDILKEENRLAVWELLEELTSTRVLQKVVSASARANTLRTI